MYSLPNQRPEGSNLKILSGKRISLLRVDISDYCLLFRKGIKKQLQARNPGDPWGEGQRAGRGQDRARMGPAPSVGSERKGLGSWLHLLLLTPSVILSCGHFMSLHLAVLICKMGAKAATNWWRKLRERKCFGQCP